MEQNSICISYNKKYDKLIEEFADCVGLSENLYFDCKGETNEKERWFDKSWRKFYGYQVYDYFSKEYSIFRSVEELYPILKILIDEFDVCEIYSEYIEGIGYMEANGYLYRSNSNVMKGFKVHYCESDKAIYDEDGIGRNIHDVLTWEDLKDEIEERAKECNIKISWDMREGKLIPNYSDNDFECLCDDVFSEHFSFWDASKEDWSSEIEESDLSIEKEIVDKIYEKAREKDYALLIEALDSGLKNGAEKWEVSKGKEIDLKGKTVITTGLSSYEELYVQSIIEKNGGVYKPDFVKSINILIYNPNYDHETVKLKESRKLISEGKDVTIITDEEFLNNYLSMDQKREVYIRGIEDLFNDEVEFEKDSVKEKKKEERKVIKESTFKEMDSNSIFMGDVVTSNGNVFEREEVINYTHDAIDTWEDSTNKIDSKPLFIDDTFEIETKPIRERLVKTDASIACCLEDFVFKGYNVYGIAKGKFKTVIFPEGIKTIDLYTIHAGLRRSIETMVIPEGVFTVSKYEIYEDDMPHLRDVYVPSTLNYNHCLKHLIPGKYKATIHVKSEGEIANSFRDKGYKVEIDDWSDKFKFDYYEVEYANDYILTEKNKLIAYPKFDKVLKIPEGVTSIKEGLFMSFTDLEEVILPESIKEIDRYAFKYCTSLKKINFPKRLKEINTDAFQHTGFEEIYIPKTVCKIHRVFQYCYELKKVEVEVYDGDFNESGAFEECDNLRDVIICEGSRTVQFEMFKNCGIENLTLPSSLREISSMAFMGCSKLKRVVLPYGLEKIEGSVFKNCEALEEIDIPSTVKEIGHCVFEDCYSLQKVTLHEGLKKIGSSLFANCNLLKEVEMPDSVTTFGELQNKTNYTPNGWFNCPFNKVNSNFVVKLNRSHPMVNYLKEAGIKYTIGLSEADYIARDKDLKHREELFNELKELRDKYDEIQRRISDKRNEKNNNIREIEEQKKVIENNKGIFGGKRKIREEAEERIKALVNTNTRLDGELLGLDLEKITLDDKINVKRKNISNIDNRWQEFM